MNISFRAFSTILLLFFIMAGCAPRDNDAGDDSSRPAVESADPMASGTEVDSAVAILQPTDGNETSGTVTFTRTAEGVRVQGTLTGLTAGEHGFHVHQYGDCRAGDGTSAGGHYNPGGLQHGGPSDSARHMGDLGNIAASDDGTAEIDFTDPRLSLDGPDSIIGRGVIVHQGADDLQSQPSGAAGARIACGEIGIANPAH